MILADLPAIAEDLGTGAAVVLTDEVIRIRRLPIGGKPTFGDG